MQPKTGKVRPVLVGAAVLAAALAVELVDELAGGVKSAALPLIRRDLGLSYGQIGLLESAPLLLGSIMELPLGILAGHGRRRRRAVLLGGAAFILTLIGAAAARSFAGLLVAFVLFFPASGAFVSLTQSGLMDADPGRREQHMARWELAGSAGSLAGPVLVIAVLAAGGGWRSAYLALAAAAAAAWLGVARNPPVPVPADGPGADPAAGTAAVRRALPVPPLRCGSPGWSDGSSFCRSATCCWTSSPVSSPCTWLPWCMPRPSRPRWAWRSGSGPGWPGMPR